MADKSDIEWCDATWQPVLGCTRVSPGCDNCYAISVVHRAMSPQHEGLTKMRGKDAARPGVDWNGTVRLQPERMHEPLHWKKARRVFVCSLADLFHEQVPFSFICDVFATMADTPQHTYLVLTKRPARALEWYRQIEHMIGDVIPGTLPNVHLGVSVEDQARADERIPLLLQCPAALHWVSAEPLLGPLDLSRWLRPSDLPPTRGRILPALGWGVVGGESGSAARTCVVDWVEAICEQYHSAGVPLFVKQMGSKYASWAGGDRKGGDPEIWPARLRVRQFPKQSA